MKHRPLLTFSTLTLLAPVMAQATQVPSSHTPTLITPLNQPETEFDISPNIPQHTQAPTTPITTHTDTDIKKISLTSAQIAQQPELLHRALSSSVLLNNVEGVRTLLPIYQQSLMPKDDILLHLAQAMIARHHGKAGQAAQHYQKALAQQPDMEMVRLHLAQSLFEDHQNREADSMFHQIQNEPKLPENIHDLTSDYRKMIQQRQRINTYANAHYTRDNNINNAPKVRTITTKNGAWHLPQPKSAQGFAYRAGISKDTSLLKNYIWRNHADLSGKFYWDNHPYDELNIRASTGIAFRNARSEFAVMPYYERRWFATKKYATETGIRLEASHWLTPKQQLLTAIEHGRDHYDSRTFLNGHVSNGSLTWLHVANPRQYFTLGTDVSRKSAQDRSDSYRRKAIRASWSQNWGNSGFNTLLSANYGQREYDARDFFNIVRQDKELSTSLSLWHNKVKLWGVTPRIVGVYSRTNSNHFMYNHHKAYAFVQLSKSL